MVVQSFVLRPLFVFLSFSFRERVQGSVVAVNPVRSQQPITENAGSVHHGNRSLAASHHASVAAVVRGVPQGEFRKTKGIAVGAGGKLSLTASSHQALNDGGSAERNAESLSIVRRVASPDVSFREEGAKSDGTRFQRHVKNATAVPAIGSILKGQATVVSREYPQVPVGILPAGEQSGASPTSETSDAGGSVLVFVLLLVLIFVCLFTVLLFLATRYTAHATGDASNQWHPILGPFLGIRSQPLLRRHGSAEDDAPTALSRPSYRRQRSSGGDDSASAQGNNRNKAHSIASALTKRVEENRPMQPPSRSSFMASGDRVRRSFVGSCISVPGSADAAGGRRVQSQPASSPRRNSEHPTLVKTDSGSGDDTS